jgi:uncharacterized protein involved in cysteine biosynthesis
MPMIFFYFLKIIFDAATAVFTSVPLVPLLVTPVVILLLLTTPQS